MINQYECVFIITPVLSDGETRVTIDRYKKLLKDNNVELISEESWGIRKLAYPIEKKTVGNYHLFEFRAESSFISKLETEFRRDERILRFLTVKLDKFGIEYNKKRRKEIKEKEEGDKKRDKDKELIIQKKEG